MPPPPVNSDQFRKLLQVMATLRGTEGCPWDLKQDHRSLIPFLVEETYELIEAIETGSDKDIQEELGDVLLQVVFHARIAEEEGKFKMDDVAAGISEKLIERHPHVFGEDRLETAEQVLESWHANKMKTRKSALDGVPSGQPALLWARQTGSRAAKSGFEWESLLQIFAKINEEVEEIKEELARSESERRQEALEEEVGDLLFAVTQLTRWLKIDPEMALRRATRKFKGRFQWMEAALHEKGEQAAQQKPEQWWKLWEQAKEENSLD